MEDLYRLIEQSQVSVDNVRDTASTTTTIVKDMYLGILEKRQKRQ